MSVHASFTQLDSGPGSRPRPRRESVRQLCSRRSAQLDERVDQAVDDLGVVEPAAPGRLGPQLVEVRLVDDLLLEREVRAALVGEGRARHRPAAVQLADRGARPGTNTSSRNTSLNSESPVICRSGRTSTPGACMSTTRNEMPRCFGGVRIGAHEPDAPAGELRVARPHLLAADRPARFAVGTGGRLGARGERREVAARAGLAEQLAPDLARRRGSGAASAARCSSVPCASSVGPARLMPTRLTGCGAPARAYSMLNSATSTGVAPRPPYAAGHAIPTQRSAASRACQARPHSTCRRGRRTSPATATLGQVGGQPRRGPLRRTPAPRGERQVHSEIPEPLTARGDERPVQRLLVGRRRTAVAIVAPHPHPDRVVADSVAAGTSGRPAPGSRSCSSRCPGARSATRT